MENEYEMTNAETAETAAETVADDRTAAAEEDAETACAETEGEILGEEPAALPGRIAYRYGKELRQVSAEEAAPLLRMGEEYRALQPELERLRQLSLENGVELGVMIDRLCRSNDAQLYRRLLADCGGNEAAARQLFAARVTERERQYAASRQKQAADEKEQTNQRLAEEFQALSRAFPSMNAFRQLPPEVIRMAFAENISLTDAYYRYQYAEEQRTAAAGEKRQAAAAASGGSLRALPEGGGEADGFLAGLRRALS